MILKTIILFDDVLAEKYGTDAKLVWGDFMLNLEDVSGFGTFVKDSIEYPEYTDIYFRNGQGIVIGHSYKEISELMFSINGPWHNKKIC